MAAGGRGREHMHSTGAYAKTATQVGHGMGYFFPKRVELPKRSQTIICGELRSGNVVTKIAILAKIGGARI